MSAAATLEYSRSTVSINTTLTNFCCNSRIVAPSSCTSNVNYRGRANYRRISTCIPIPSPLSIETCRRTSTKDHARAQRIGIGRWHETPKACPPVQPLERLSQPGVRSAHASVMAALIRGAIERYAPSGPITALRPGTRVLDFLYCDNSPRDTLSVIMLPSVCTLNHFPFFRSVFFVRQKADIP